MEILCYQDLEESLGVLFGGSVWVYNTLLQFKYLVIFISFNIIQINYRNLFDKKYVKKKERERHLPGSYPQTLLEQTDQLMKARVLAESSNISSIFIVICLLPRCLRIVARQVSLSFLLFNISFYLSRFCFYINRNQFVTQYITHLNIWGALSRNFSSLSTHD